MGAPYLFSREDTGEIVEVDFVTMMDQKDGYITLDDGMTARRRTDLEDERDGMLQREKFVGAPQRRAMLSENMGFGQHQLGEMKRSLEASGIRGIEFVRDAAVPQFYNVKCSDPKAFDRYAEHRGYVVRNRTVGNAIDEWQLRKAEERAKSMGPPQVRKETRDWSQVGQAKKSRNEPAEE